MGGAKGSALEWALALHRAPTERHALRQKPLPIGLGQVLGIAAGSMPGALAEAAQAFGESEARVREAAQFYVREVLFFPQADAYRVLGVAADASAEQIKAHHRLLQHWLHPDRLQSEDDAIFATRVNGAWNHLRNPLRRQAYDETLQEKRPLEVFDSNGLSRSTHAWVINPEFHQSRWHHYLPMLLLSVACIVLILLVFHDKERRPDTWDWPDHRETASAGAGDLMNISVPLRVGPDVAPLNSHKSRKPKRRPERMANSRSSMSSPSNMVDGRARVNLRTPVALLPASLPKPSTKARAATMKTMRAPPRTAELPTPEVAQLRPSLPPASRTSTPGFSRIQLARNAGDQFLRYMSEVNMPPPPIWNSPGIQSSANNLRHELHGEGRVEFDVARWRIGNETAVVTSGYTNDGKGGREGLLTADMVWRDGHWLVTGLSMERAK